MFYSIVNVNHTAFRSYGNFNNLFGMPLSLGEMPTDVGYALFELGISIPGEMTQLARIIKPEIAIITNIGPAHLETMKTIENIVKAKLELVDNLPDGAVTLLNADDPLLMAEAKRRKMEYIGFGIDSDCDFRAGDIETATDPGITFTVNGYRLSLPIFGRVNVYNALAAIAASSVWNCGPEEWRNGLAGFAPADMRMIVEEFEGVRLLIDCYNANPDSVRASLNAFRDMETSGKRIAVLGDMLELGDSSDYLHKDVGKAVQSAGIDHLLCIGVASKQMVEGAIESGMQKIMALHFDDHQSLLEELLKLTERGDGILFKGSRGIKLEKIVIGLKGSIFKSN
jgi:UDP-N-acetylmuramoyl-tripeptide--D-alanyl-D-alanine ligase